MFQPKTIRVFSVIAIILSIVGLLLNVIAMILPHKSELLFIGLFSWAVLTWSGIIAYQLTGYKLYDEEYKKVGIRIYLIIALFFVFLFTGLIIGVVFSLLLFGSLWGLKQNYNEWDRNDDLFSDPPPINEN